MPIQEKNQRSNKAGRRPSKRRADSRPEAEFEQKLVDIARVTRVTKGGKRLTFRACVVIGNEKNQVAYGVAKGADVTIAIDKAVTQAKKRLIKPRNVGGTIPYEIVAKFKSSQVKIRPGKAGRGIIAGGVVRTVFEMAGYHDIVAKMIGSKNKINNVKAVYNALKSIQ